jgi:methyl acetate hydrolase
MSIDELLEQGVADRAVPGVVAGAADRDGTVYEGAFGSLSVEAGGAVGPDTMFWLASMTKAIVSVVALQLIEQGSLTLDQPVVEILPRFGELQVLDGFDGDTPRLRPPVGQATVRNLFTHTAGTGYYFINSDLLRYQQLVGVPDAGAGKLATLYEMPLVADPGTRFEYGMNLDWLGLVVEAVTGETLDAVCDRAVFGPLAMPDTTFTPSDEQRARLMTVHSRTPDGGLVPTPLAPPADAEYFSAGSGLFGTAGDYLRFLRALLRGGELDGARILSPGSVELAFGDHLQGAPLPEVSRSAVPELTNEVPSLPVRQGFGLGFRVLFEDIPGMRRAGTGDWAGLANCYYWADRASGLAGVFLTQVLPFFDARVLERFLGFEQALYAAPTPTT